MNKREKLRKTTVGAPFAGNTRKTDTTVPYPHGNKAGITLVALVITIIVLLILAGITINLTIGQRGILRRAEEAGRNYQESAKQEDKALADLLEEIDGINGGGPAKKPSGQKLVDMYNKAVLDGCTNGDGTCTNKEHLHIGDYVDYAQPISGTYTVTKEKSGTVYKEYMVDTGDIGIEDQTYEVEKNQLNWRVLGKDETTGGIKLISGRPMKSNNVVNGVAYPYLYLYGDRGYLNSEEELNAICGMYTTSYGTARSIMQKDVDEITGVIEEARIKEVDQIGTYGNAYHYENQYTPESHLIGERTTVEGISNAYAYYIGSESGQVEMSNKRAYNMLFDNVTYPTGAGYWLASRSVDGGSSSAEFCVNLVAEAGGEVGKTSIPLFYFFGEDDRSQVLGFGVRPVVCLKSDITEGEVGKIEDKTEEIWSLSSLL